MTQSKRQVESHEPIKVGNPAVFKSCLFRHLQWQLATDHGFLNWAQYLILIGSDFWYSA